MKKSKMNLHARLPNKLCIRTSILVRIRALDRIDIRPTNSRLDYYAYYSCSGILSGRMSSDLVYVVHRNIYTCMRGSALNNL